MKQYKHLPADISGHYFNKEDTVQEFISNNYEIPTIMSSHLGRTKYNPLEQLIKTATDDSLIIYIHRHETDRVLSGIKQVGEKVCTGQWERLEKYKPYVTAKDENGNCVIEEQALFDMIREGEQEIGNGVHRALTCNVFDAIEANKPNLVVLNYQQVNELQNVLAKYHCPDVLKSGVLPIHVNEASSKDKIYVKLKNIKGSKDGGNNENRKERLDEWVQVKKHVIEWAFGMKKDAGCQRKVKDTEKMLMSCDNKILQFL